MHPVFAVTALFPLFVSFSALLIDEPRVAAVGGGSGAAAAAVKPGASLESRPAAGSAAAADSASAAAEEAAAAAAAGGGGAAASSFAIEAAASSPPPALAALSARVRSQGAALWGAVKQKDILLPTVFVFLWQATPTADSAMFYFYTNQLHFQPEFLGRVRLAGSVASLAGVALYNGVFKKVCDRCCGVCGVCAGAGRGTGRWAATTPESWGRSRQQPPDSNRQPNPTDQVPLKRMFLWAMVLGTALGSTQLLLVSGANRSLGLSDELFVLGDSVILTVLGQVGGMVGCLRWGGWAGSG